MSIYINDREIKSKASKIDIEGDFEDLYVDSVKNECREGVVVKGLVVAIERGFVIVDVGLKSECAIPLREFALDENGTGVEVGQYVDVYIERFEGANGGTLLSREMARKEETWNKLVEKHEKGEIINGKIVGKVKAGMAVDVGGGLVAFLPARQLGMNHDEKAIISTDIDYELPLKIVKMNNEQGNIIVSHLAVKEESRKEEKMELLSKIEKGSVLKGVVKNVVVWGAFIDLGPVDGLLHITDISWNKISHPSEVLKIGQEVEVMVIGYNSETQRISLGLKQLERNPWDGFEEKYKVGQIFDGTVTTITDYGAFVELEPKVEGLVHHTEISWNVKNANPKKLLKTGDEVRVKVIEMDVAKHRIALSLKQSKPNPWKIFAEENPVGSIVEGIVSNVEHFGIFVTMNKDNPELAIDVIIPVAELPTDDIPEKELKKFKKDDSIQAVVVNADPDRERITLSLKQLHKEVEADLVSKYPKNSVITCKVIGISSDTIEVEVDDEMRCIIKRSELSKHRNSQRTDRFAVDERVDAKVVGYDKKKLLLSIKALEVDQERKAIQDYGSTNSGALLSNILGAAFQDAIETSSSNNENKE